MTVTRTLARQAAKKALEVVPEALRNGTRRLTLKPEARMRQAFVRGDMWYNSEGWRGPLPEGTSQDVIDEIAKYFTSVNKIKEVTDRHLDAVIGIDPKWSWTTRRFLKVEEVKDDQTQLPKRVTEPLKDDEQKRITRLNEVFTDWIDRRTIFWKIREKSDSLCWQGSLMLRCFIPDTFLDDKGGLKLLPLDKSINRIRVMVVDPGTGYIVYDETDEPIGSVYKYHGKGTGSDDVLEYSWVDHSTGLTNLFNMNPKTGEFNHIEMDLNGQLMMFELRSLNPLVSDSVVQLNAQLNVALTMAGRNVVQGGFLERVLINADLPGKYITVSDGMGGTREVFIADDIVTGPNTTLSLVGQEVIDPETDEPTGQRLSPSIQWKDPVGSGVFKDSADFFETQLYSEVRQLHAKIMGDAVTSGVSRQQALQDFAMSINPTTRQYVQAFRWMFDTVLRLGLMYSSEKLKIDDLRIIVQCRLGTRFLTSEEQNIIMSKVEKKMISRETGMLELGIDDPDAEKAMIQAETVAETAQQQTQQSTQQASGLEQAKAMKQIETDAAVQQQKAITEAANAMQVPAPTPSRIVKLGDK